MKKTLIIIVIIFLTIHSFSQFNLQPISLYQTEMQRPPDFGRIGGILIGTGTFLTVGGIILASTADWQQNPSYYSERNYSTTDPIAYIGLGTIILGVPMIFTGIVFKIIDRRTRWHNSQICQKINLNYFQSEHQRGLTLTYRF